MAHSKRNSTSAFFTQSERAELRSTWGSRSTRLTRENFLPFGSCNLCLLTARDPVSCSEQGHLFCRECAVSNLLAQSKEIKRLKKEAERRKAEADLQQTLEQDEQQTKDLAEFERVQSGLKGSDDTSKKRKLQLSESAQDRDTKRRTQYSRSYWIPGQQLADHERTTKVSKERSSCPVVTEGKSHDLSLKTMIEVKFKTASTKDVNGQPSSSCPSCDKLLSNTTKGVLARPCGHVLCKSCSDKFQGPIQPSVDELKDAATCFVCQTNLATSTSHSESGDKDKKRKSPRGLVELRSDGTGFAGGGKNMVKREGLAFQVG